MSRDLYLARIGDDRTRENLDERRLSSAVLTNERMDFSHAQFERGARECLNSRVCLRDTRRAESEHRDRR